jgi:prophage antirepressor-like protein
VNRRGRKVRMPSDLPIDFFARWISRYILKSIITTGSMSEAYELMLQDAHSQLMKRMFSKEGKKKTNMKLNKRGYTK